MELDELKASWEALSEKVARQQKLNTKLIEQMTRQNYHNRLNKIVYPEYIGSLICFGIAIFILWNFNEMDTTPLRIFGGIAALLAVVLPLLSIKSLQGLRTISMTLSTYVESLRSFESQKLRFQLYQKASMGASYIFSLAFAPVCVKLSAHKDITRSTNFWLIIILFSVIVMVPFSRWVYKHYNNNLKKARQLLAEIDS